MPVLESKIKYKMFMNKQILILPMKSSRNLLNLGCPSINCFDTIIKTTFSHIPNQTKNSARICVTHVYKQTQLSHVKFPRNQLHLKLTRYL